MFIRDDTDTRRTDSLSGFLRRWRRNAYHAGLVAAAVTFLAAAVALFALCACKSIKP